MANVALNLRDSTRIKQWCCKRFVKRVDNRGLTLVRLVLHEAKTKRVFLMSCSGLDALCYSEGVKHETKSLRGRDVPAPTCQAEAFQMQAMFYGVEFKHAGNSFFWKPRKTHTIDENHDSLVVPLLVSLHRSRRPYARVLFREICVPWCQDGSTPRSVN